MPTTQLTTDERARLRGHLNDYFDLDELKDLAFDLGVDYQHLPHRTKSEFSRELIGYFERRGQIGCLVEKVVTRRPDSDMVRVMSRLPPCTPNKKVQIIKRGAEREFALEELRELARILGADPEEIEVIAAASDSVHVLIGVPESRLEGEDKGWLIHERPSVRLDDFGALDEISQTAWRVLSVCLSRRESAKYILPTFSWGDVKGAVASGSELIAWSGDNPRRVAALWFYAGEVLSRSYEPGANDLEWLPRWEDAAAAYGRAIELDPYFARPYFGRAGVRSRVGDFAGAFEDATNAARLSSSRHGAERARPEGKSVGETES